jgi:predicted small lipoprotein YifL
MKKLLVWIMAILAVIALASCVFKGTATFHLENKSTHTITAVNFVAVVGGTTDNNAVNIEPDDGKYFYRIEPGTYDINLTMDGVGEFPAWNDFVFEEGTVYLRAIDDGDLP